MLKGEKRAIENQVIAHLTENGGSHAIDMYASLRKQYGRCTLQGLYQVLRRLQSEGVIVKDKKEYSLSIAWLIDLSTMVEQMQDTYLQHTYLNQLLPKKKQKYVWTFSHLLKMNSFWSHLLLVMARDQKTKIPLHYSPHAWYLILHKEHSFQFTKALLNDIDTSLTIVGSRSYLDKMSTRITQDIYPKKQFYLALPEEYIHEDRSVHIDVVGEYVLEVQMDTETTRLIENLFKNTKAPDDIDAAHILPFYAHKAQIKMTLKKDPRRAGIYRKKFENIFGPLDKV